MLGIDPKVARYAWSALAAPVLVWLLFSIRRTLFVFVVALMFAYLLYPLVEAMDRLMSGRRRSSALVLPFILILALIVVASVAIGRQVQVEVQQFASPGRLHDFTARATGWTPLGLPLGERLMEAGRQVTENLNGLVAMMPQFGLGQKMLTASRGLVDVFLVPILSFLILKEGREFYETFLEMLGEGRLAAERVLMDAHRLLLQYMRALLLLCLATLITFSVVLKILGVHYAILLASIAFALEFVPMAGPLAAGTVIIVVAYFSGYPHPLWWVMAFLCVYRILLDYVISPHLMKRGVELHPLLVLFGVFAGGEIGGVAGIFLSVPVLALIRLLFYGSRNRRILPSARQLWQAEPITHNASH